MGSELQRTVDVGPTLGQKEAGTVEGLLVMVNWLPILLALGVIYGNLRCRLSYCDAHL